jgi:hypothetical protein
MEARVGPYGPHRPRPARIRLATCVVAAGLTASPVAAAVPAQATVGSSAGRLVRVSTGAELEAAMANARPGDTIRMADGVYRAEPVSTVSGTPRAPITLTGSRRAVIVNGTFVPSTTPCPSGHTGYGVWLNGASHWRLTGFTVQDSKKGIVMDHASGVVISGVLVQGIQEEGVHFRAASRDGLVQGSTIRQTGLVKPGFGEGVYIGSAYGNWRCYGEHGAGTPDRSDRVRVIGNRFGPDVAAEHIDIKEGTVGGRVIGNFFDGRGLTGENSADSWLDVKGSRYLVLGNFGSYRPTPGSVFADGYETHEQYDQGYGCGNVFRANASDLAGVGAYGFLITNQAECPGDPNVVYDSNVTWGAVTAPANIPLTPDPWGRAHPALR